MTYLTKLTDRGSILLSFVITLPFVILIAASYISLASSSFRVSRKDQFHTQAQFTADAGADYAVDQINQDEDWNGTSGEVELHNDGSIKTTYQVSVASGTDTKTITATGRTYWPASSVTSSSSVTVKVDLRPVTSGDYSVVSGVGGLVMSNSAKILGGDVLVNGTVSLSNTAQIGLTTSPVDLEVAHHNCPTTGGESYPQACTSGQPISLSNTSHIYGSVRANNQTNGDGMTNPGLVASSGVTPGELPEHDRAAQTAAATTTITGTAASCNGSQTRTWAANTKITGNVSIANNCVVTVNGDVWITGNLNTANSARMIVSNSVGSERPSIMIDGSGGADFRNTTQLQSNSSGTGFEIVTYWSSASCSPNCSSVTGNDLFNSRNTNTITLDNSASGPETIFYARWTRVNINNSGQIGALIGQSVRLANSGTITFGTSVASGTSFWVIDGYRRDF